MRDGGIVMAVAVLALVAACGPEVAYSYDLGVRNDLGSSRIVVPANTGSIGAYRSAYEVQAGSEIWVKWANTLSSAQVFVFDVECRLVAKVPIPQGLEHGDPRPNAIGMTIDSGPSLYLHSGGGVGPSATLAKSTTLIAKCPSTEPSMWAP